jgi:hypothetical protein
MSVSNGHAGIWGPFVPVRISIDYSTHVRLAFFVISLFELRALSSALWQQNKVIIAISCASWLTNIISYTYCASISWLA